VRELKRAFPDLQVVVNGGLREPDAVLDALEGLDGIMLGREAYHRPMVLGQLDALVFGAAASMGHAGSTQEISAALTRARALERMRRYTERQLTLGERLGSVVRHVHGLYTGEPGSSEFQRTLSELARRAGAGAEVLAEAVAGTQGARDD
jgi:tRNA-dihydrouridine synthase A